MFDLLLFILNWVLIDGEVGLGARDVPTRLTELRQVLQQVQLFIDVVHDQARVNLALLLSCLDRRSHLTRNRSVPLVFRLPFQNQSDLLLTVLDNIIYVDSLLGVYYQHLVDDVEEFS